MVKPNLSVLSDWPFCIGVLLATLGALPLVKLVLTTPPALLWFVAPPLSIWTGVWLLIVVWRIWLIPRINREGIIVDAQVTEVGTYRSITLWVNYTCNGKRISTRFSPWGFVPVPRKGGPIRLVVDPRKPTRCWVHKG